MNRMLVLVALLVGACAFDTMNAELPTYVGRPVTSLVVRLGFPSNEQSIMGRKVYTWRTDMDYMATSPVTTTSTAYVHHMPVTTTSTGYVDLPAHSSCAIRAAVNADETIASVDFQGDNRACLTYSSRLASSSGGATSRELQVVTCKYPNMDKTYQQAARSCTNNGGTIVSR